MQIFNDNVIAFDIDDTLVMWDYNQHDIDKTIEIGCKDYTQRVLPHEKHIQCLKNSRARGHFVIAWSQGGNDWTQAVINALCLENYVNLVMCKPRWMYDDVKPNDWTTVLYKKLE